MDMSITLKLTSDSHSTNPQAVTIKNSFNPNGYDIKFMFDNRTLTMSKAELKAALEALDLVEGK